MIAVVLLAGCQGRTEGGLAGSWQLTFGVVDGEPLGLADAREPITLELTELGVSGVIGCNDYTARAHIEAASIEFSDIIVGNKACVPRLMELEHAYAQALLSVTRGIRQDGRLRLTGPDLNLVFEPKAVDR